MNKTLKSTIDTIGTVMEVITDNLQTYTTKALNDIKNTKPEVETQKQPVLGYQTGTQGWFDMIGGGPCNTYCRYTGLSPNIQWTCSNENDLTKLRTVSQKQSGRYCYDYDKKTIPSVKKGIVIKGNYFPTITPNPVQSAGDYNFLIYNNKNAQGVENFSQFDNYQNAENFETQGTWSPKRVGEDHPANDLAVTSTTGSNDCQAQCVANSQCNGIVIDDAGTTCWQKGTLSNPVSTNNRNTFLYTRNNNIPVSESNIGTPQIGIDYPGNDIINENVLNSQECLTACQNQVGCNAFVTNSAGNYCWLKRSLGEPIPNNDRVSYTYNINKKSISTDPRWNGPTSSTDSPYNDLSSFAINQVSDCGTACYNQPSCVGFVTNDDANYCWLKKQLGNNSPKSDRNIYTIDRNTQSTDPRWVGPERNMGPTKVDTISQETVFNANQCGNICNGNQKCKGFLLDQSGKQCFLLNNVSEPVSQPGIDMYKMKTHYEVEDNLTLGDCENVCQNDNSCKGFSYDTVKSSCVISQEKLNPVGFNTSNIVGNKKQHMALTGTYNIYQNNACVNSSLFGNNPTVTGSMGLLVDTNGVPKMPKQPVCASGKGTDFIFGNNFEIMAIPQDISLSDNKNNYSSWGQGNNIDTTSNKSWDSTGSYCLQNNPDNTVSTNSCTYLDNQKWTYDESMKNIRTWDGNCLNVDTSNNNVKVGIKPCVNDINQQFILGPVSEQLQLDYNNLNLTNGVTNLITDTDIFNTSTNINTNNNNTEPFHIANTDKSDYLYKSPYLTSVNHKLENYQVLNTETTSMSMYLIYLIVLLLLVAILMRK